MASFFIHFLLGAIGALVIFILRIIKSTNSVALIIGWILRLIPSFSFGYGILNISSRDTYAILEGRSSAYEVFDLNIAGGDVLMMALEGPAYLILIFVIEKLMMMPTFSQFFTNEKSVPFKAKPLDDDVAEE